MSNVFTITTELKLNREYNQLVDKYISDYIKLFNKIQRLTFHRIKNYYIKNGEITQKDRNIIHAQLKKDFNLTSRATDAILSNMLGRYESIKGLKEFERNSLERKIFNLEKELTKLKDERAKQRINLKNDCTNFNFTKYKNLKIKIYWKQNKLNTKKQKLKNLEKEIETGKYKVCFGTKKLLQKDYKEFIKKRDSEIYFLGRAGENTCNNNFQVKYDSKINQFYFRIRKEIDLDNDKFVLLKDSVIVMDGENDFTADMKKDYIKSGKIKVIEGTKFAVLLENIIFESDNDAAAFVTASTEADWTMWVNINRETAHTVLRRRDK